AASLGTRCVAALAVTRRPPLPSSWPRWRGVGISVRPPPLPGSADRACTDGLNYLVAGTLVSTGWPMPSRGGAGGASIISSGAPSGSCCFEGCNPSESERKRVRRPETPPWKGRGFERDDACPFLLRAVDPILEFRRLSRGKDPPRIVLF